MMDMEIKTCKDEECHCLVGCKKQSFLLVYLYLLATHCKKGIIYIIWHLIFVSQKLFRTFNYLML